MLEQLIDYLEMFGLKQTKMCSLPLFFRHNYIWCFLKDLKQNKSILYMPLCLIYYFKFGKSNLPTCI